MSKIFDIAVIPGVGTGPEVVAEALKCLRAVADKVGFAYEMQSFGWGGERYLRTGEVLPGDAVETLKEFDAILLGAIGHPDVKPGILEKGILLSLRFALDQYINLRPVKLYEGVETPLAGKKPVDIDFVVVRENNEGEYSNMGGRMFSGTPAEIVVQESVFTRRGVERAIRYAFELARKTGRKRVTSATKSNGINYTMPFRIVLLLVKKSFNSSCCRFNIRHIDMHCKSTCCRGF